MEFTGKSKSWSPTSRRSSGDGSSSSSSLSSSSKSVQPSRNADVGPQTSVRPFGYPEYNYCWIENKSKSNFELSCHYDYKNRYLVQQQEIFKDNPLSSCKSKCNPRRTCLSENDEDLIVSDVEDKLRRNVRLRIKEKNIYLTKEHNLSQVLPIRKVMKSKKMPDIPWKLYRIAGESLQDIKERLLRSFSQNKIKINTEVVSNDEKSSENEHQLYCNNARKDFKKTNNTLDLDSVSNTESISYFTNGECVSYDNIESKYKSDNGEKHEETTKGLRDNFVIVTNATVCEKELEKDERDDFIYNYESPCLLADFLDIEIYVNEKENVFIPTENDSVIESINWSFEKSSESLSNALYKVPMVKQLPNDYSPRNRRIIKRRAKKVPRRIEIKSPVRDKNEPIICEMYGTRTINYNHSLELQAPKWPTYTNSTDTSEDYDSEIQNSEFKEKSINPDEKTPVDNGKVKNKIKMKQDRILDVKDNFSKEQISERTKSIGSCCESDLSKFSYGDDYDVVSLNAEDKKSSFTPEEKYKNYSGIEDIAFVASIKREDKVITSPSESEKKRRFERSKIAMSMTSTEPVVDPGTVKVKKSSTDVEEDSGNVRVTLDDDDDDDDDDNPPSDSDSDSSSSSSSSSSSCSRSSCLCASSSSSSSSSVENDRNGNITRSKNKGF